MNFSIDKIFYTVIFILIIFIGFEFCSYLVLTSNKNEGFTTYKMCDYKKLNLPTKNIIEKYDIKKHSESNFIDKINPFKNTKDEADWDVYIPCGYNFVENEMNNINFTNPNQKIYAIDGCDNISSKNNLWKIIRNYYGREKACHLMPETYNIDETNDINLFFNKYKNGDLKNKTFLLKKNIQRKQGIFITNDFNKIIKEIKKKEFKLIQHFIENLYLINNRKLNIRLYILIICQNNIKSIYLYNQGKCIYTNKNYNQNDYNNYESHLTSLNMDIDIYKTNPESLDDLKSFIGDKKYNILYKNIIDLLTRISIPIKENICNNINFKKGILFQLFGADIIFTNDLHPYLLEFNKGPAMKYMTPKDELLKNQLIEDVFIKTAIISKNEESKKMNGEFILL